MADAPTTAYTEVQIDDDSISLTLITESGSSGPVIEDTERFTFEELQDMAGEHLTLRLSGDSRESLSDQREDAVVGNLLQSSRSQTSSDSDKVEDLNKSENLEEAAEEMPQNPSSEELLAYMGLLGGGATDGRESAFPEVGQVVIDRNAPSWSKDDRVEVVEVRQDVRCDEYVIQGHNESEVVTVGNQDWTDETVADANPSFDADDAVIIGQYAAGDSTEYAFPSERLDW